MSELEEVLSDVLQGIVWFVQESANQSQDDFTLAE